ncbi:ROK family protein [Spongisporangium articulatum]|uniref:ROK family protein n=1 Tax=Spongisporangium articulatum TaxID=3362603 RepID=A0ABW8ALT9_9ACTN
MARGAGIAQDELRRVNLGAVLSRVHASGPTSRAALTAELGLNRSTIGDLTAQLAALGLVSEELPTRRGGTGRPSHLVVPRTDVTVVAVLLDVDRIVTALVGLGGVVLARRERLHQRGGHDVEAVVATVAQAVAELQALPEAGRCLGVGVSVPGVVRADDGMVRSAPNLGWTDAPFSALLHTEVGLPVRTGNDANLGVYAEHLRGAAVGVDDVAYVSGSVGIGGGFLVGGQPLRGAGGYAGEIGHLCVDLDGARCRCGAVGCWETRVGENHLLEAAGWLPGGGLPAVDQVTQAAMAGDVRAGAALEEAARWIGVGLRAIVNMVNPEMIVLSGVLAKVFEQRRTTLVGHLRLGGPKALQERLTLVTAALGDDSSLFGAAETAFEPLLADPTTISSPAAHSA